MISPRSMAPYDLHTIACVHVRLFRSCLTLCDPMDYNLPGSSVHGLLQARILEWVCHALLQRIFLTQGSNPHLLHRLHWQVGSLPLAPPGKPFLSILLPKGTTRPRVCINQESCVSSSGHFLISSEFSVQTSLSSPLRLLSQILPQD